MWNSRDDVYHQWRPNQCSGVQDNSCGIPLRRGFQDRYDASQWLECRIRWEEHEAMVATIVPMHLQSVIDMCDALDVTVLIFWEGCRPKLLGHGPRCPQQQRGAAIHDTIRRFWIAKVKNTKIEPRHHSPDVGNACGVGLDGFFPG